MPIKTPNPDPRALPHVAALLDLFGYPDVAIETLDFWRDRFAPPVEVDQLIDLLVPPVAGRVLPFDEYWRCSADLFRNGFLDEKLRPHLALRQPRYVPRAQRGRGG